MLTEKQINEIDRNDIEKFIDFLTGNIDSPVHWQWFDDRKQGKIRPGHFCGTIKEKWDELVDLNKRGAGIFVTINDTDGIARKRNNIRSIRCVCADLDGQPLSYLKNSPIKFHLLVNSSPERYHAYMRIKDVTITDTNREKMADLFTGIQKSIAERIGSDASVCNLNQVMRCPGFYHQKKEPFQSRILSAYPTDIELSEIMQKFEVKLKKDQESYDKKETLQTKRGKSLYKFACGLAGRGIPEEQVAILTLYENWDKCDPNLPDDDIYEIAQAASQHATEYGLSGKKFDPKLFTDAILSEWKIFSHAGRHYRYEDGYYKPWDDLKIKKLVLDWSNGNATVSHLDNLVKRLEIEAFSDLEEINPVGYLNTLSGIIKPETGEIIPHTPEMKFTIQLPVKCNYLPTENPRTPNCPIFHKFLEDVLPDPMQRDTAWEILGYCLTTDCRLEKAIMLFGGGSNGKTVFLNILRSMLRGLISELRLSDLAHSYRPAILLNKLVNLSAEGEAIDFIDDAVVKSIISGEPITVEQKYKDPMVIKPFCKLVLATNHLPRTRDKSKGYFRRWLILHFDQDIPEDRQDKLLSQRIIESELDEIFYGALLGLRRLRYQNGFTVPESSKALLNEYEKMTNPALTFIEEHLAIVPDGNEFLQEIYNAYRNWCENHGHKNMLNQSNLRKEIEKHTGKEVMRLTGGRAGFKGLVVIKNQRLREIRESVKCSQADGDE